MRPIIPGIISLFQYLRTYREDPRQFRPQRCCHCGRSTLWYHGHYDRKSDRESGSLNPIPISRFYCPTCRRTCSTLPECIPPRRWYLWLTQQAAFLLNCAGHSCRSIRRQLMLGRHTIGRWWRRWKERHGEFSFSLRTLQPRFGYLPDFEAFWLLCLSDTPLSQLMIWLNQQGVIIP